MKKILLSIPLLVLSFLVLAQPKVTRSTGANTVMDTRLGAIKNFLTPVYSDTIVANQNLGIDSCGAQIFTYDIMGLWVRACSPKRWKQVGSVTALASSNSILISGDGSPPDPYIPTLIPSAQSGNIIQIFPDGVFATTQTQIQNGLISGGLVIWQSGLTYIVTAATYAINGVIYNSPETTITLDIADVTNPRFDAFVVTTSSTATNLTGTPAADPQNPSYNPATQLPLTFVQVTANMIEPVICRDSIYFPNNGQTWAGAVSNGTRINLTSTSNPYSVTQDIEFTAAQNNDQLRLTKSTVISWGTYSVLVLKIRSKGAWAATSRLNIRMYNGLTPLGINVALGDGIFGFNSSITNVYQTIAIPLPNLGNVVNPDNILFSVSTTGANTIGFHLDDIELLGCEGTPVPVTGRFWSQGGDRWGTTGVIGTLDNFPMQHVVNNTNHLILNTNGTMGMQGTNPGVSFQLNSFGAADYSIRRVGTDLITNTAGTILNRFTGNTIYSFDKNNGHIWSDSLGTNRMRLAPTGALRLNAYGVNAFTGTATKWLAVDVNGNVIEQAPPLTAVSASNALNMVGTDVQLGGLMTKSDTILNGTSGNFRLNLQGTTNTQLLRLDQAGTGGVLSLNQNNAASGSAVGLSITMAGGGRPISAIGSGQTSLAAKNATNNTVLSALGLFRSLTSGSGAVGVGTSLEFYSMPAFGNRTGAIESVMTDVTSTDEESDMNFYLINSGPFVDYLRATLHSDGNWTWPAYGTGAFTGTPAYGLAVDASGNVIEAPVGGGISGISGDNGVTENVANNIQLGGTLIQPTTIATGSNSLTISTATSGISPLIVDGTTGTVATIFATTGIALTTYSTSTVGPSAQFTINASTTNTVIDVLQINRATSGSAAIGIGASIDYSVYTTVQGRPSNQLISKWTTVTDASRVSEFSITGVDNAITSTLFKLSGNGALQFNKYGVNTFAGVAAFVLGVDASGNLVEVAAAGSGMTNVLTTTGSMIYSSSGTTPAELLIGTPGQVLRVSAGGIPEWFTTSGSGTVTSVGLTSSDITVGGSSPITGSGTFTLTLATVNSNVGTFGSSTSIPTFTVNAKGLITAASGNAVIAPAGTLTGTTLASNVLTTSITSTGALASGSLTTGFTIGDVTMNLAGTDATGDMYYRNASGVLVRLPIGTAGQIISSVGGIPTYVNPGGGTGTVTNFSFVNLNGFVGSVTNASTTPALTIGTSVNGIVQGNGTGASAITNSSTVGQVLRVIGVSSYQWGALDLANSSAITGALLAGNGGTGVGGPFTSGNVLIANGTGWTKAPLTGGTGIIITPGAGSVTISSDYARAWITVVESGSTINWNTTTGANARVTLNGTGRTLNIQNPIDGYVYTLRVIQGSGGSRTITTWTNVKWPNNGTLPTLSTTAGQYDIFQFKYEAATNFFYGSIGLNYN